MRVVDTGYSDMKKILEVYCTLYYHCYMNEKKLYTD